ncbi:MAG TPA: hypothetical protein PLA50_15480 [Bacteroidia bacterium]|nr:hypothetical protein [Bacteroidia bacterium]
MKTWHSFALWLPIAGLCYAVTLSLIPFPPASGVQGILANLFLFSVVLLGPISFLFLENSFWTEPTYIACAVFGLASIAILILNRNRKKYLNVVSGFLWCASGAIALFIGVLLTI